MSWVHLILQSLILDHRLLRVKALPLRQRVRILASKYRALASLAAGRSAVIRLGKNRFEIDGFVTLGTLQSSITDLYHEVVQPGLLQGRAAPNVLDVGANVGQFTHAVKLFYPDAHIQAFEAHAAAYRQLVRNTAGLADVLVHHVALGQHHGELPFYEHNLSVMSSFQPYVGHEYPDEAVTSVRVRPLDSVAGLPEVVSLLKVDVEGFELEVLKGAGMTLDKSEHLLVEVSLGRPTVGGTNADILGLVSARHPDATLVVTGRLLGDPSAPICQDFVFALHPQGSR